jgi:ATP-binding cassette subfamily F protein uup
MAEAYRLQDELGDIKTRNTERRSHIDFVSSERETRRLLVGKNMEKTLGERTLFKGLDLQLSPGSRLAIAGTNGAGKTTLLKLIAGSIQPDQGTIKRAENLKVVLFDQHREQLPLDLTLKEALCPTGDEVYYRGRHIHVNGWAQRFLFPKERIELPIRHLSGGERARILIARLMLKEADILLLDEPTNDLDIPTLELLEDSLVDFPGALVLITHDRTLLSRVATEVIGIGCGHDNYYFADLEQWERYRDRYLSEQQRSQEKTVPASQSPANPKKKTKLSYKEKRELEALEAEIEELESSQASCQATTEDPGIQSDASKLQAACEELQSVQERLETCYHRWEELSMKEQ